MHAVPVPIAKRLRDGRERWILLHQPLEPRQAGPGRSKPRLQLFPLFHIVMAAESEEFQRGRQRQALHDEGHENDDERDDDDEAPAGERRPARRGERQREGDHE